MNAREVKTQQNTNQSATNNVPQQEDGCESTFQFVDNRPEAIQMRKLKQLANNSPRVLQLRTLQDMANNSPQAKQVAQLQVTEENHSAQHEQPIQKKENNTGLPDNLKSGIENLSGYSMRDVKVHFNSDKPAQLNANAYAQGTDIHLASGQEEHLPHEAWHVVQQKQGRVKPTIQLKGNVNVNDDAALENEADVMREKAVNANLDNFNLTNKTVQTKVVQLTGGRADNPFEKTKYKKSGAVDSDDRHTPLIVGEANTAHHIIPHSDLKQIYESLTDSNVPDELKKKVLDRFTTGSAVNATDIDDYVKSTKDLKDEDVTILDSKLKGKVSNSPQLSAEAEDKTTLIDDASIINIPFGLNTYPITGKDVPSSANESFKITTEIKRPKVDNADPVKPADWNVTQHNDHEFKIIKKDSYAGEVPPAVKGQPRYKKSIFTTDKATLKKTITKAHQLNEFNGKINTALGVKFKNIFNELLEWAKGNQFYGPNANFRYENDKVGVDSVGKYYVDFDEDAKKGDNAFDYLKDRGENLHDLNDDDSRKVIYAQRIKPLVTANIKKYRVDLALIVDKSSKAYTDLLQKINTRYDRLLRLYTIDPTTNAAWIGAGDAGYDAHVGGKVAASKETSINIERAVEQAKAGKIVANKDNYFVKEHWIALDETKVRIIEQVLNIVHGTNKTLKAGGTIHYSEILDTIKPGVFSAITLDNLTVVNPRDVESNYDALVDDAKKAGAKKLVTTRQIKDLKPDAIKHIVILNLQSKELKLLIKFHLVNLIDAQVGDIKDIAKLDKPTLILLTQHKLAKLDAALIKAITAQDQVHDLKAFVTKAGADINDTLVATFTGIGSLDAAQVKLLTQHKLDKLDVGLVKAITAQDQVHDLKAFVAKAGADINDTLVATLTGIGSLDAAQVKLLTQHKLDKLDVGLVKAITAQDQVHDLKAFVAKAGADINDTLVATFTGIGSLDAAQVKLLTQHKLEILDVGLIKAISTLDQIYDFQSFKLKAGDDLHISLKD